MPPETHFVPQFIQASGRLRFNPRIAVKQLTGDENRRWNDFGLDADELQTELRQLEAFNTADALRAFYGLYAKRHGKSRWGDKTPDYVRKMKKIQNTLPEARFIHVIRDGRDAGAVAELADRQARQGAGEAARDGAPLAQADHQVADRRRPRSSTTSRSATRT